MPKYYYLLKHLPSIVIFHMICFIIFLSFSSNLYSQSNVVVDTSSVVVHSPQKATYLALIPGAGQIYNKKYWKLPIVYAGFAVLGYFAVTNRSEYIKYNDAYVCTLLGNENNLVTNYDPALDAFICNVNDMACDDLARKYTSDQLKSASDYYRRNMELTYILLGAWYGLQILDAVVDAHLYNWEVNDNLSLRVEPTIQQLPILTQQMTLGNSLSHNGLKITVSF